MLKKTKERRRRGRRFTDDLPGRGQSREEMSVSELQGFTVEQRDEMRGMRDSVRTDVYGPSRVIW